MQSKRPFSIMYNVTTYNVQRDDISVFILWTSLWASKGGSKSPLGFWNYWQKKVVFSISRGKKQISPLPPPWKKIWENPLLAAPGKNPSDAHGLRVSSQTNKLIINKA